MLWLAAGVMFLIAIIHSFNFTPSRDWVSSKLTGSTSGSGGRLTMKEHINLAETAWARTVRDRHNMIRTDYGTIDKVEL